MWQSYYKIVKINVVLDLLIFLFFFFDVYSFFLPYRFSPFQAEQKKVEFRLSTAFNFLKWNSSISQVEYARRRWGRFLDYAHLPLPLFSFLFGPLYKTRLCSFQLNQPAPSLLSHFTTLILLYIYTNPTPLVLLSSASPGSLSVSFSLNIYMCMHGSW